VVLAIPAILTLGGLLTCVSAFPGSFSTPQATSVSDEGIPPLETLRLGVDPPARIRLTTGAGRRLSGPWTTITVEGLEARDGTRVSWSELGSAERLSVGRRVVAATAASPGTGWGLLVVALSATGDESMADRAVVELRRRVGDRWPAWETAIAEALTRRRAAIEQRRETEAGRRLRRTPPHLEFDRPDPWPTLTPAEWKALNESQRDTVLRAVEGLDYDAVPTRRTLVVGPGSVDEQAAFGVRVDRIQDEIAEFLGVSPELIAWPGRMVVIRAADRPTARILAAHTHQVAWPHEARSVVIPTDDGPGVILTPIENPIDADAELVRAIARGVMPYLETGRVLPPWLVEGTAEAAADRLVASSGIDRTRRPRAHVALRAGRDPIWITTVPMDHSDWGPDGLARDVAQVMAVHLREHSPTAMATVIRRIKEGATVDAAFQAGVGLPFGAWTSDSLDWFHFND